MRVSRGYSLIEMMLALVVGAIALAAGVRTLLAVRRFWFAERAAIDAHAAARDAALVLAMELRGASPASGDLLRTSDTAVTLRAQRALLAACAAPGGGVVLAGKDPDLAPRTPAAPRESVLVWLPGATAADDRWIHAQLGAVSGAACPGGGAAWKLTLQATAADRAALDSVPAGAPLRTFETIGYRLYDDGTHTWWLGSRSWQGGSWASTTPIAGPLRAKDGVQLRFLGAGGAPALDTAIRSVAITVRAVGPADIWAAGRAGGVLADSVVLVVAPRN